MSKKTSFVPELEAMRGIAAIWVVFGHCFSALILPPPHPFAGGVSKITELVFRTAANSVPAVWIFFVLSGLVLSFQLASMKSGLFDYCAYLVRRLVRLMIPVWVSVTFAALIWYMVGNPKDLTVLLKNYLLLDTVVNDPLWSLQVEVVASALLPLLVAFLLRSANEVKCLILLILFYFYLNNLGGAYTKYVILFYCGVSTPYASDALRTLSRFDWWALLAVGMAGLLLGHAFLPSAEAYSQVVGPALLVLFVYANRGEVATAWLRRPTVAFLGKASYPIYLIHYPTINYFMATTNSEQVRQFRIEHAFAYASLLFVAVLVCTLLLSALMVKWVELPSIAASRSVGRAILALRPRAPVLDDAPPKFSLEADAAS